MGFSVKALHFNTESCMRERSGCFGSHKKDVFPQQKPTGRPENIQHNGLPETNSTSFFQGRAVKLPGEPPGFLGFSYISAGQEREELERREAERLQLEAPVRKNPLVFIPSKRRCRHEKKPWLVGLYIGDEKLPSYIGTIS